MLHAFNVLPWFPPEEYEQIRHIYYQHGTLMRIPKNTLLKSSGDKNRLFYLLKGLCICSINGYPDKMLTLALLLSGRAIGDITCISGETVNMSLTVKRDAEVLTIPAHTLVDYMEKDPQVGILMARTVLAKRNSHLEGMLNNSLLSQDNRLRVFFKALIESTQSEVDNEWYKIDIKLSNEDIAHVINSTRVSVSRILSEWATGGFYKKLGSSRHIHKNIFNSVHDWRSNKLPPSSYF